MGFPLLIKYDYLHSVSLMFPIQVKHTGTVVHVLKITALYSQLLDSAENEKAGQYQKTLKK